MATMVHFSGWQ